jgi:hypothetical protein
MSTFSRRIIGALSTILFATALTAGATATAATPGRPSLEPDPSFEIPTVGECRNYGLAAVAPSTNESPTVSCGDLHTSKVIATPLLPEALTWESPETQIHLAMVKACLPAFRSILGRTERLRQRSAYEVAWFTPTQTQRDAGARWLRCDLVLYGGSTLMPIRRNAVPILPAAPLPKSVTSCLVGPDDAIRKTVCTKTHRYRAAGTWRVDWSYYPGHDALLRIAKNHCPSLVSTPRWWYAFWMDQNSWKAGDRIITCYSHTSS